MVDEYEREYMGVEGPVLHRQKAALPKAALLLGGGLPPAVGLVTGATLGVLGVLTLWPALAVVGGGALLGALMLAIFVLTGVTRVVVSPDALHLQMGTSHVRIPIDEIESVELGYSGSRARGIGFKKQFGGNIIYNMLGDPERAVRIKRRGRKGVTSFVCKEPEELAGALQRAMGSGGRRVRVEVADASEPDEDELPAEARAEDEREA